MLSVVVQNRIPICQSRLVRRIQSFCAIGVLIAGNSSSFAAPPPNVPALVDRYCVSCHDTETKKGGLNLENIRLSEINQNSDAWERVVRKLRARQMPPLGKNRPDEATYDSIVTTLSTSLDRAAKRNPNPGRTETFRRLNRTEYQNAIRDLLALNIDATALLPKDDAGHGFDNGSVGVLSPALLDRYISAAQKSAALLSARRVGRPMVTRFVSRRM
jgi:hypothetical protein